MINYIVDLCMPCIQVVNDPQVAASSTKSAKKTWDVPALASASAALAS